MTSKIDTIYDTMISIISTNYPDKIELINPYSIGDNDDLSLRNGFGLTVGNSVPDEISNCILSQTRDFEVVLSKKLFSRDNSISARKIEEKALMNEAFTLHKAFKGDAGLRVAVNSIHFAGDDGIQFVFGEDRQNYIYGIFTFECYYSELY